MRKKQSKNNTNIPVLEKTGDKSFEEIIKIVRSVQKEIEKKIYSNTPEQNVRVL